MLNVTTAENYINSIVIQLAKHLVPEMQNHEQASALLHETSERMTGKVKNMPRHLALAMSMVTILFDWYGVIRRGARFVSQSSESQQRQIQQWRNSPIVTLREFIQFYEKLLAFIYYSLIDSDTLPSSAHL
jgi:hypothetical protein